jgi:hypothetical protein
LLRHWIPHFTPRSCADSLRSLCVYSAIPSAVTD